VISDGAGYSLKSVYFLSKSGSQSKLSSHPKYLNCFTCSNIDPSISILEHTKCFPLKSISFVLSVDILRLQSLLAENYSEIIPAIFKASRN